MRPVSKHFSRAFSLIELMTTMVIVGIITAIGLPAYSRYVVSAKSMEAQISLDILSKNQIQFHLNNEYFPQYRLFQSTVLDYATLYKSGLAIPTTPPGVTQVAHAFPSGKVFFDIQAYSGKTDSTGAQITPTLEYPRMVIYPTSMNSGYTSSGSASCSPINIGSLVNPVGVPNYDWTIIVATRDFQPGDNYCTRYVRAIEKIPGNEYISTPIVSVHLGM